MTQQIVKRQLPILPHPDHLRKQAKTRLNQARAAKPEYRLTDAQRDLAHEYGFISWVALQAEVTRRGTTPVAKRVRTRRYGATQLVPGRPGDALQPLPELTPSNKAGRSTFVNPLDNDEYRPIAFLHTGLLSQVCFAVTSLIGVGIICFVLHKASAPIQPGRGPGLTPIELLHKVI